MERGTLKNSKIVPSQMPHSHSVSRVRRSSAMPDEVGWPAVRARWRHMRLEPKRDFTDEEVALYFAAADAVFIQRLDDLNSGNLPMAFLFRKAVAGPAGGNIGEWLRKTDNPVFDPQDPDS